ncbi:MAG: efflux transporter outer membrane subunit [Acidiferrobacteraceae bacterium]
MGSHARSHEEPLNPARRYGTRLISRKTRALAASIPLAVTTLTACATFGSHLARPNVTVPARFSSAPQNAPPAWPKHAWWRGFGSPELNQLIEQAEHHNFSIRIAVAQLEAANAQVRIAGAPLLPSLSGNGSVTAAHTGGGSFSGGSISPGAGNTSRPRQYAASVQVSYELDFWGKNRDALKAAEEDAAASRFNRDTVALTAVSAVASTWFQILADHDELSIAKKNLAAARGLLAQLHAEFRAGTTDEIAIAQQAALVATQRAAIPNIESQLRQEEIGLGILVGRAPERLFIHTSSLRAIHIPKLTPGLPSELLSRRPDIAQALATLAAAKANVQAAQAAFFPTINLTGSAGWESAALKALFSPGSLLLSATGSLTQPIFQGGALTGQLAVSRANYRQDLVLYQQAVVQAFTDVEKALTAFHYATQQEAEERIAVKTARVALAATRAQLSAGVVNVGSVLVAEQTYLNNQNALEQARLTRLLSSVSLYKALGGGWNASPSSSNS